MMNWFTPTLDPEELEKRITDLKTVLFWLEQNCKALNTTIQTLEVQKLTLSTLHNLNIQPQEAPLKEAFSAPLQNLQTGGDDASGTAPVGMQSAVDFGRMGWEMLTQQLQQLMHMVPAGVTTASSNPDTVTVVPPKEKPVKKASPRASGTNSRANNGQKPSRQKATPPGNTRHAKRTGKSG